MKTEQKWKIGDCLELLPEIPDKSVDLILTDLPYGSTACAWDVIIPFVPLWKQYKRIIKDDGAMVFTANQPFTSLLILSNIEMFRYRWIWDKEQGANFQLAKLQPLNNAEDICVFSKAKTANGASLNMRYYPIKTKRDKPTKSGGVPNSKLLHKHSMVALHNEYFDTYPKSIIRFKKPCGDERIHPTQKPLALFEYLIKTYTNEGDMVHDSCLGSGTTLEACMNLNRNCIGFEIDPQWEQIYRKRLKLSHENKPIQPKIREWSILNIEKI